ncbi:hypothetical protein [Sodalis sp. C49]|uniref:hypothetical protein n=1 Tax=unclassified Sodalis (in: enterobacteria) TaxID=2636512 RepID=UPI00396595FA
MSDTFYQPDYAPEHNSVCPVNPLAVEISLTSETYYINPQVIPDVTLSLFASSAGVPHRDALVTWSSSFGEITQVTETDNNGITTNTLMNSVANPQFGTATVTASVGGNSASINIIYFNASLLPVRVNGLTTQNVLPGSVIKQGVQALIYRPVVLAIGDVFTFYWGSFKTQRFYDGTNIPWVIDISGLVDAGVDLVDGTYLVYYEVESQNGFFPSTPLLLAIEGSPYSLPTLAAPTLPYISDYRITYNAAVQGVIVQIPGGQPNVSNGDHYRITLALSTYAGVPIRSTVVAEGDVTNSTVGTNATINYFNLRELSGVNGSISYSIINRITNAVSVSNITRVLINTVLPG